MNITENEVHEKIKDRKIELKHHKNRSDWANCLYLQGQISELQGLVLDIASQPAVEADAESRCYFCNTPTQATGKGQSCPKCGGRPA